MCNIMKFVSSFYTSYYIRLQYIVNKGNMCTDDVNQSVSWDATVNVILKGQCKVRFSTLFLCVCFPGSSLSLASTICFNVLQLFAVELHIYIHAVNCRTIVSMIRKLKMLTQNIT